VNTTNIDAEAFLKSGELAALLTLIGIGSVEQSKQAEHHIFSILKRNREQDKIELQCSREVINHFSPAFFWRRDPHEWRSLRALFADESGNVVCLRHQGGVTFVNHYKEDDLKHKSFSETQMENEDIACAKSLSQSIAQRKIQGIKQRCAARLWNGRIFDSLEAISKIRQLSKGGISKFDDLVLLEKTPLLPANKAVADLELNVCDQTAGEDIDRFPSPFVHYTKSIAYPSKDYMAYIAEMKEMAHAIARENGRASPSRPHGTSIFISYDLEKRVFKNQESEFRETLSYLSKRFGDVTLIVNGLTSGVGGPREFAHDIHRTEIEITKKVVEGLDRVTVLDMFGYTIEEKLRVVQWCDFYLAPKGNASLIPMLVDVPGIYYGSSTFMEGMRIFDFISKASERIDMSYIIEEDTDLAMRKVDFGNSDGTRVSYSLVPGTLLNLTSRFL